MTPTVSVVTIFLDAAPYLQEAIDSVRAQTFEDWELVLVDDGSTDGSSEIAGRAADADPRVRCVEHPGHANRGMSASRNLGVDASSGPFVALLDADDVYLPEKLEHQVPILTANPDVGMVYGPMTLWFSWTGDAADAERDFVYPTRMAAGVPIVPPDLFVAFLRLKAPSPATCSVLLRRAAIERVGGFEDEFPGMFEDKVFFHKIALRERVLVTDRALDRYRQHDASSTARALVTGEWHRHRANLAGERFMAWLEAQARLDRVHGDLVRREVRRARVAHRWDRSLPGRAVRRVRRRVRRRLRAAA